MRRILNPEMLVNHRNVRARRAMVEILEAGLQASDPYYNTRKVIRLEGNNLIVGNPEFEPEGALGRCGNRVLEIEAELGSQARFPSRKGFKP